MRSNNAKSVCGWILENTGFGQGGSYRVFDPGKGTLCGDILAQYLVVEEDGSFSKRASLDEWFGVKVDLVIWDHVLILFDLVPRQVNHHVFFGN